MRWPRIGMATALCFYAGVVAGAGSFAVMAYAPEAAAKRIVQQPQVEVVVAARALGAGTKLAALDLKAGKRCTALLDPDIIPYERRNELLGRTLRRQAILDGSLRWCHLEPAGAPSTDGAGTAGGSGSSRR